MLQGRQFRHDRHQAGVLAFHSHLLADVHFLSFPYEQVARLVMRSISGSEDPVPQGEPGQGYIRGKGCGCLRHSAAFEGTDKKDQCRIRDGEVE